MPRSSDGALTRPSSSPKDSVPPPTVMIAGAFRRRAATWLRVMGASRRFRAWHGRGRRTRSIANFSRSGRDFQRTAIHGTAAQ